MKSSVPVAALSGERLFFVPSMVWCLLACFTGFYPVRLFPTERNRSCKAAIQTEHIEICWGGENCKDMILLITGASHTGKTLLAQRMLEKYKAPYLSIDHLKMGLIRSGNTDLTPEDDEELVGYLWPIVREMIKTAIENRQSLTVEGCYIPFDWRKDFDEKYLQSIRFLCLAMSEEYIGSHFEQIKEHACDIEARLDDSSCTVERLKNENREFAAGFRAAGEQVTIITEDYEETIKQLV